MSSAPEPNANLNLATPYLATVVTIDDHGLCRPAHEVAARLGTLHVITAWNPGDERPAREVNGRANEALRADLARRGLAPMRALGSDPSSEHAEESWAVSNFSDCAARELGAKYRQVAVFRITSATQTVLGCFAMWSVERGV
jgi:hypothetical protein